MRSLFFALLAPLWALAWLLLAPLWAFTLLLAMAAAPERHFWTSKETAEYLGIPLSTLRYWQYQRTGPRSYRIGRQRKYKPADVIAWAESQADRPAAI